MYKIADLTRNAQTRYYRVSQPKEGRIQIPNPSLDHSCGKMWRLDDDEYWMNNFQVEETVVVTKGQDTRILESKE